MKWNELLAAAGYEQTKDDPEIADLQYDSRRVGEGTVFFCLRGENADGHDYAGKRRHR